MARIFTFIRGNTPVSPRKTKTSRRILVLSWVSRAWRDIALGCGKLWSVIDCIELPVMETFLGRSKGEVLTVDFHSLRQQDGQIALTPAAVRVLEEIHRIQDLQIGWFPLPPGQLTALALPSASIWEQSAPVLRRLNLQWISLPDNVFKGHAPVLDNLSLRSCHLPLTSPLLSLPSLKILTLTTPREPYLALGHLLQILRQLPGLEELRINSPFDPRAIDLVSPQIASFAYLRVLILGDISTPDARGLFDHVRLPASAQVDTCAFVAWDRDDLTGLIEAGFAACRHERYPIRDLAITGSERNPGIRSNIKGGEEIGRTSLAFNLDPYDPDGLNLYRPDAVNLLEIAVEVLNLQNITQIDIDDGLNDVTREILVGTLGSLTTLQEMQLGGAAAVAFLRCLELEALSSVRERCKGGWPEVAAVLGLSDEDSDEDVEIGGEDEDEDVGDDDEGGGGDDIRGRPMPNPTNPDASAVLDSIGVSFRALRNLSLTLPEFDDSDEFQAILDLEDDIVLALAIRRANGIGLNRLQYSGCPITPRGLKRLKAVADEVVVQAK